MPLSTESKTFPNPVPTDSNAPALSVPAIQPQPKRPGSPISPPSPKKISSRPAELPRNQIARQHSQVNRSPLSTISLTQSGGENHNPCVQNESFTKPTTKPWHPTTKGPRPPRILGIRASFSASTSAPAPFSATTNLVLPISTVSPPDRDVDSTHSRVSAPP